MTSWLRIIFCSRFFGVSSILYTSMRASKLRPTTRQISSLSVWIVSAHMSSSGGGGARCVVDDRFSSVAIGCGGHAVRFPPPVRAMPRSGSGWASWRCWHASTCRAKRFSIDTERCTRYKLRIVSGRIVSGRVFGSASGCRENTSRSEAVGDTLMASSAFSDNVLRPSLSGTRVSRVVFAPNSLDGPALVLPVRAWLVPGRVVGRTCALRTASTRTTSAQAPLSTQATSWVVDMLDKLVPSHLQHVLHPPTASAAQSATAFGAVHDAVPHHTHAMGGAQLTLETVDEAPSSWTTVAADAADSSGASDNTKYIPVARCRTRLKDVTCSGLRVSSSSSMTGSSVKVLAVSDCVPSGSKGSRVNYMNCMPW